MGQVYSLGRLCSLFGALAGCCLLLPEVPAATNRGEKKEDEWNCDLFWSTHGRPLKVSLSVFFKGTSIFRKIKAVEGLRGGVAALRRTRNPED
jgi:hypothetical protein